LRESFRLRQACRQPHAWIKNRTFLLHLRMGHLRINTSSFDIEIILQRQLDGLRER
jgi:hypothetical protein